MSENLKTILKNTGLILIIIAISALLVRHFLGSETLSDYAKKNPSANEPVEKDPDIPPENAEDTENKELSSSDDFPYLFMY